MSTGEFAHRLLSWHAASGRHDLPWQTDRSAYRVWVSEIMLQQTQVNTVIPYFQRFTQHFPGVQVLAAAPLDQVLGLWSGLGYYARARNLHKAAGMVAEVHDGELPQDIETLMSLPGIGRSTAGAILALSSDQRHPILDGNVKRVLARHFAVAGWPGERAVEQRLWALSASCTPATEVATYTQAIMDLGATICSRSRPGCDRCPLKSSCQALAQQASDRYPGKRPRKPLPVRSSTWMLLRDPGGAVLLQQRPPTGLWGGLWCPPELPPGLDPAGWSEEQLKLRPSRVSRLAEFRHTFSHFHLDISPLLLDIPREPGGGVADAGRVWYKHGESAALGLAAPVERLLSQIGVAGSGTT
jgi:A/G-specific adenine glycosylase